jgi:lipopolysaccharide export LptBFGC system permease protein LptF
MTFPWTLQRYLFREMGKAFLLAAVALTAVFGLGGGVLNVVKLGEVTPGQLARLIALLLPLSAALTLPIAALFAAAATYGRVSADNELTACRSSGININVLFLPTLVLSLLAGGSSFALTNYIIPGMFQGLDELVYADLGTLFQQRLSKPRGVALGNGIRVSADESVMDSTEPNAFIVRRVAFLQGSDDQWVRFGTAREIHLGFERRSQTVRVSGVMLGVSYFDRKLGQFFEEGRQEIPPNDIPPLVQQELKFLNLGELLYYYARPEEWHDVKDRMDRLRRAVAQWMMYDELQRRWIAGGKRLEIADERVRFVLTAQSANRSPTEGYLELLEPVIEERSAEGTRRITAERAVVQVVDGESVAALMVRIRVQNATLQSGGVSISRQQEALTDVHIDQDIVSRAEALDEAALLAPPDAASDPLSAQRADAVNVRGEVTRRIVGTLCERATFSASVFVLVILAAALGVMLRGAHVMTAFGISFVPTLFVMVCIMTGRQMSHNAGTHVAGIAIMCGGMFVVAVVDVLLLTRWVRR